MTPKKIINTFLSLTAVTTVANSLIWGVNTLFLLAAGMNIFQVMIINAAFTTGQLIFNIPTGVIADTIGRRASYLLSTATILASTLAYVVVGYYHLGIVAFMLASIFLGLGFTFYTGAVDAWMVDALHHLNYKGEIDPIFARGGIVFGASMLVGTTMGGILGQYALWLPYVVRAFLLIPAFLIGLFYIKEIGFTPMKLKASQFGEAFKRITMAGVKYVLGDRVVLLLMLSTFVQGLFFIYGFYSWQKYFLDLLHMNLVWVAGVIAALTTNFFVAVALYLVFTAAFGCMTPIKASWLNSRIPSEQRATLISMDSNFSDVGGTIGQLGLGYISQAISIPFAWLLGGAVQLAGWPLIYAAKRREKHPSK